MTMPSNAEQNPDLSQSTAQQSQETGKESTQARTYSEEEHQAEITKAVREATGKQGREHKLVLETISKERDDLKTRLSTTESKIESIEDERKSLREQIEDLTSDDPKKFDLVKRERELRTKENQYKQDLQALETKDKSYEERESRVSEREKVMTIFDVAAEYDDPDPDKLSEKVKEMEAKLQVKINTEEQIRSVAEILWGESKAKEPPEEKEILKTYSGKTEGGGSETLEELLKVNVKKLPYQERLAHQKKLQEARKAIKV